MIIRRKLTAVAATVCVFTAQAGSIASAQTPSADPVIPPTVQAVYCIEVLQGSVDFTGDAAALQEAIVGGAVMITIVADSTECATASDAGTTDSDLIPLGSATDLGGWDVSVKGVNGNAMRAILQENSFNDRPARGQKVVLITIEASNTGDTARNVYYDLEWSLYVGDDQAEEYSGVLPRDLVNTNEVPPGRRASGTIAFSVPQSASLEDMVLYMSADYYAEFALQ